MMIPDSCVSWAVLTFLVLIACLRFFFWCVNRSEQNKDKEPTMNYDQDLFF